MREPAARALFDTMTTYFYCPVANAYKVVHSTYDDLP